MKSRFDELVEKKKLTTAECIEMFTLYEHTEEQKLKLYKKYEHLAVWAATSKQKDILRDYCLYDDAIQEAYLTLWRAIDMYKPIKRNFTSYLTSAVYHNVAAFVNGFVYSDLSKRDIYTRHMIRNCTGKKTLERSSKNTIKLLSEYPSQPASVNETNEEGTELLNFIPGPEEDDILLKMTINDIIDTHLTKNQAFAVRKFFQEGWTKVDIGTACGVSREMGRIYVKEGLRKLKLLLEDLYEETVH